MECQARTSSVSCCDQKNSSPRGFWFPPQNSHLPITKKIIGSVKKYHYSESRKKSLNMKSEPLSMTKRNIGFPFEILPGDLMTARGLKIETRSNPSGRCYRVLSNLQHDMKRIENKTFLPIRALPSWGGSTIFDWERVNGRQSE